MKTKLLCAALLLTTLTGLRAAPVLIASPTKVHVRVFSTMNNMGLRWKSDQQVLQVNITFSNVNYVSPGEPLSEQKTTFILPGVKYDEATRTFYKQSDASRTPVAVMKEGLFGGVRLAPGAKIMALDKDGTISLLLTAERDFRRSASRGNHARRFLFPGRGEIVACFLGKRWHS
jgi:hypothetical protein